MAAPQLADAEMAGSIRSSWPPVAVLDPFVEHETWNARHEGRASAAIT